MGIKLAVLLVVFNCAVTLGQNIKTDVLVVGGSPGGVAAAIQCARSKVKTVLIEQNAHLCPGMTGGTMVTLNACRYLPSGIWGEFRRHVIAHYSSTPGYDTAFNAPLKFQEDTGAVILAQMADTIKNLNLKLNTTLTAIKRDGDHWEVSILNNGEKETIKARVVIDATETTAVTGMAGARYVAFNSPENKTMPDYFRTSVAMGDSAPPAAPETDDTACNYPPYPAYCIPMRAVIAKNTTNLLVTGKIFSMNGDMDYLPAQLTVGQGAGVTAAYCAFFKTTTANLNVRMIQGELLDFKGYLLPFADIGADPYWRAIQQVCATGMLKGVQKRQGKSAELLFMPDSAVSTAGVKPCLLQIYTHAFLWFNREKPGEKFTVGNLLSFMSEITLTDPDNMRKGMDKAWVTKYKFTVPFKTDRPVTRREFAILVNQYLNPFARTVDMDGKVVN